jgi:hypothetical protein
MAIPRTLANSMFHIGDLKGSSDRHHQARSPNVDLKVAGILTALAFDRTRRPVRARITAKILNGLKQIGYQLVVNYQTFGISRTYVKMHAWIS